MVLRLTPTPDIARALGQQKRPGQVLVAFAAETGDLTANAHKKAAVQERGLRGGQRRDPAGCRVPVDTQVTLVPT